MSLSAELIAMVAYRAYHAGYFLVGPAQRVYVAVEMDAGVVESAAAGESEAVRRLVEVGAAAVDSRCRWVQDTSGELLLATWVVVPTGMVCPECGEPAVPYPPRNRCPAVDMPAPLWSHTDREPLCPVMTARGYAPALPAPASWLGGAL